MYAKSLAQKWQKIVAITIIIIIAQGEMTSG